MSRNHLRISFRLGSEVVFISRSQSAARSNNSACLVCRFRVKPAFRDEALTDSQMMSPTVLE
jgi:hypothetical protein